MGRLEPAEWYDAYYRSNREPGGMRAIHDESAREIMSKPGLSPDGVLDLGCGPGWFRAALRDAGYDGFYRGWDFSPEAIRQARLACPLEDASIFSVRDLTSCPADVDPYKTMVVALEVLEHLEDDVATLKRFARRGGQVLVSVPTYDSASHVRHFSSETSLAGRYGIKGQQWELDRQLYIRGVFV